MSAGQSFSYDAAGIECIGYLAKPEGAGPFPGILVSPAFGGLGPMERGTCDRLAALGYVALGVDYYSGGRRTEERSEAAQWMSELQSDRALLAVRMQAALTALKAVPEVGGKVGAMGYCFGGKSVLDLARSGAEFAAGVTLHGVYDAPPSGSQTMQAAMLICDGWDDTLCPPEVKVALGQELNAHCADWQFLSFGHTEHGFCNPASAAFSPSAEARSWRVLTGFFDEVLRGRS